MRMLKDAWSMKQKRRVINLILALVCCLSVFLGSGLESRAEESEVLSGTFEYNGVELTYYYISSWQSKKCTHTLDAPAYFLPVTANRFVAISFYPNSYNQAYPGANTAFWGPDGGVYSTQLETGFTIVSPAPNNAGNLSLDAVRAAFVNYAKGDDFNDLMPFIPDFENYYHEDTDIWINDMRAELKDGVLYSTWDSLAGNGVFMLEGYENTYIDILLTFVDDKGTVEVADDSYWSPDTFFTELPPNEFSVDMSEFGIPDGYRLHYMIAAPYWYFNDDVKSTMFKGKVTYMFFDENGVSDYPLIKNPEDIYNPLDPNLSNWNAITNFTGDYFYNMNNVMNSTFNSWDGSGMNSDNDKLGNALAGYSQHEEVIINQVSNNISNFDFDNYLTFSDKVNAGISFGSMLINKFFVESGDFTILFVVGCVMVFIFVVVGIWRFSK